MGSSLAHYMSLFSVLHLFSSCVPKIGSHEVHNIITTTYVMWLLYIIPYSAKFLRHIIFAWIGLEPRELGAAKRRG